jgi:hypothetical protein
MQIDEEGKIDRGRTTGAWMEANPKWLHECVTKSKTILMHSRYATCRNTGVSDAHPFRIVRDGKTVLWGMHNGMIHSAEKSAKAHGRDYTVDSVELLELIADGAWDEIEDLEGYGTVCWIRADDPHRINLCRMTASADLAAARVKDPSLPLDKFGWNGVVFASTKDIIKQASGVASVELAEDPWELDSHNVYYVNHKGEFYITDKKISIKSASRSTTSYHSYGGHSYGGINTDTWHGSSADVSKWREEWDAKNKAFLEREAARRAAFYREAESWAPLVEARAAAADRLKAASAAIATMPATDNTTTSTNEDVRRIAALERRYTYCPKCRALNNYVDYHCWKCSEALTLGPATPFSGPVGPVGGTGAMGPTGPGSSNQPTRAAVDSGPALSEAEMSALEDKEEAEMLNDIIRGFSGAAGFGD